MHTSKVCHHSHQASFLRSVLEDRREEVGVEIEASVCVRRVLNVIFVVSGLALLGGVLLVIGLSLGMWTQVFCHNTLCVCAY